MAWEGFSSEGFSAQGTPFEKIAGSPADVINQMADVLDEAASAVSTQTQGGPASAPAVPAQGLGQYSEDPLSTGYSSAGWSGGQPATDLSGGPASAPAIPDLGPNPSLEQLQAVLAGGQAGAALSPMDGGPGGPADAPSVPPDLMGGGEMAEDDVTAGQGAADFLSDYRAGRGARPDTQDSLMNQLAGLQREAKELRQMAGSPSMAGVNYGGAMSALGTPGGFSTETPYVDELPQQEQFPRVFAGPGSSQFGGTELGMVPEGRRTEQGFSAQDYTTGGAEALGKDMGEAVPVDTVARNALKWVNDLFRGESEEQQQVSGQEGGGVTATGLGVTEGATEGTPITGGLSQDEQMELQQHEQRLAATRPDSNADATVSWPTIGGDTGNRTRDLNQGVLDRIQTEGLGDTGGSNADEIIGSLLQKYGSQLKMAGYGEQVEKFASGNYTKADIDGLIGQFGSRLPKDIMAQLKQVSDSMVEGAGVVVEELAGLDPNYSRFQGTTSSGSSHYGPATDIEGNKLGFNAKDYNPAVARKEGETFMDYTKRMHERNQARNWVDPDQR